MSSLRLADKVSARIENAILCTNVRIGEKAQIKDCEFGTGFQAKPNGAWPPRCIRVAANRRF